MARQNRLKVKAKSLCETRQAAYPAWRTEARTELERRHHIPAAAIPERVWSKLFVRGVDPQATADRAAIYYRSIRPAGLLWRKEKIPRAASRTRSAEANTTGPSVGGGPAATGALPTHRPD